jgi:hypothetical protein
MTRIATAEDPNALPPIPIHNPTDLKTDLQGRLIVLAVFGPPTSVPTVNAVIGSATGVVSLKAAAGTLFKAQLAPVTPFAGQLYFQLFNKAAGAVAAGDIPDWSVPVRLADSPIGVIEFGDAGAAFSVSITAAFSTEANEFANAVLDAMVTAILS